MGAIAGALGDTAEGLTGPEIEYLLASCKIADPGPMTKRVRIYNAFAECRNTKRNRTNNFEFIRLAIKPARYSREPHRYEPMRAHLNLALAFAGLVINESGELKLADVAQTLPEAQRRAGDLRADLEDRGVHPDVLKFYRVELLEAGSLYLSAITLLELEMGVLQVERRDPRQGAVLRVWLEQQVLPTFAGRILPVDTAVARHCARLHVPDPRAERDALIAATALVHGMTVVTRNVADFLAT